MHGGACRIRVYERFLIRADDRGAVNDRRFACVIAVQAFGDPGV
jgi:hypothetical protein